MPVKDVDGGLVFQGFSPRTLTDRLPRETYTSVPFRFGGSNVRTYVAEAPALRGAGLPKPAFKLRK
jgi:hypothetical protein